MAEEPLIYFVLGWGDIAVNGIIAYQVGEEMGALRTVHPGLEPFLVLIMSPLNHVQEMAAVNTTGEIGVIRERLGPAGNVYSVFKDGRSSVHIPIIDLYSPIPVCASQSPGHDQQVSLILLTHAAVDLRDFPSNFIMFVFSI